MADYVLTDAVTLTCPHGGNVTVVASDAHSSAEGGVALHPTDSFTVSGCPHQIPAVPSPIPSPCTGVVWVKPDLRVRSGGQPTLSASSVGLCFAATGLMQGDVVKAPGQLKAKST
jgi:hypothetical protein